MLRYVQVRNGGQLIAPNRELNNITLGGVRAEGLSPDALAVVDDSLRLTYAELNRAANRIAHAILARRGFYAQVWHPSLFRFSVFVCMFGALGLALYD